MLITATRLYDGVSPHVVADPVLEIDGTRIVSVGRRSDVAANAEVVDLGDATLLPGLIDIHQHLAFDASPDPVAQLGADDDDALRARMHVHAQRALAVGITTIRDLGDRNYLGLELRDRYRGDAVGPRIVASGPPITTTRGHCWFLGGEADGIDGVRDAVREHARRGVDVIKVMATGGNLTPTVGPHESQFGVAELTAVVEEAHAHGLPVAAHAHGVGGIADSLAAGVDSIEHCTFMTADGVDADATIAQGIADAGVVVSATAATIPGQAIPHAAIRGRFAAIVASQAALYARGVVIVCSSDAGIAPIKPHDVLPHGITTFLPRIGMTNVEALRTSTALAARVCGVGDITGTIEPGKDADILAVAGNPLEDITAIYDVVAVFARGARVDLP